MTDKIWECEGCKYYTGSRLTMPHICTCCSRFYEDLYEKAKRLTMTSDELIFYKDCDLITGKSGDEPLYSCAECYRYDICKSDIVKEADND